MPIYRPERRNTRLLRYKIFIYGSQKITWIVLVPGYRYIDSQQTNAIEDKSPVKSQLIEKQHRRSHTIYFTPKFEARIIIAHNHNVVHTKYTVICKYTRKRSLYRAPFVFHLMLELTIYFYIYDNIACEFRVELGNKTLNNRV